MVLPTDQISFSDLRRIIGPNDSNLISLGQCRPSFPPAYGNGIIGVTDTNIAMSQFRGKPKYPKGFVFKTFKGSSYTFTAGAGGGPYSNSGNSLNANPGSGGAGGILVNGAGPSGETTAGTGGHTPNNPRSYGGYGGVGYGAGGGGGGRNYLQAMGGGKATNGFAYLYLNGSEFFATSTTSTITYTCTSSGTLKYILMGAGGTGGKNATNSYSSAGGYAGHLEFGDINVTNGTVITITIGIGHGYSKFVSGQGNILTYYERGGTTSIVFNGQTRSALGGRHGDFNTSGTGSSAGGPGGDGQWYSFSSGSSGGNGTGGQGSTYFNSAINHVANIGGYFADNLSLFNSYIMNATGKTSNMTNISSASNSIFTANGGVNNFSMQWYGKFYAPTSGSYTFYLGSDDASYLWIGSTADSGYTTSNANINIGGIHAITTTSYTISLTGGTFYPIRIIYGQSTGNYDFNLSFTGPNIGRTYDFNGYIFDF